MVAGSCHQQLAILGHTVYPNHNIKAGAEGKEGANFSLEVLSQDPCMYMVTIYVSDELSLWTQESHWPSHSGEIMKQQINSAGHKSNLEGYTLLFQQRCHSLLLCLQAHIHLSYSSKQASIGIIFHIINLSLLLGNPSFPSYRGKQFDTFL